MKNKIKQILFFLLLVEALVNIPHAFGEDKIAMRDGIVVAKKEILKKFLPEINDFELITYENIYGKRDEYVEKEFRKYNLVFGIENDLDKDGCPEYFIAGFNKDQKIKWKTFLLILSKKGNKYIRRELIPFYDKFVLKLEDYNKNDKRIKIGPPESDAWGGFLYWNKEKKKFIFELYHSESNNADK